MIKKITICLPLLLALVAGRAQVIDTSAFTRIANQVKDFRPDTSAVPQDRFTRKIMELRQLRGGFNIDEAVSYKMAEDAQKDPGNPQNAYLREQFINGPGHRWLSNATIWIYRRNFTYKEVKKLVRFYRTPAGQKLATMQPVTMLETLAAAELIQKALVEKWKK